MGLDITAYRKLEEVRPAAKGEDGYDEGLVSFTDNREFKGRFAGLKERTFYRGAEEHKFRAGSYSGYNAWRNDLARLAGYPEVACESGPHKRSHAAGCWLQDGPPKGPFAELINFTDCDGTIGPIVAAKLAKDFADWDERAKTFDTSDDNWFYHQYSNWRKAMEFAADAGAVDFH